MNGGSKIKETIMDILMIVMVATAIIILAIII